MSGPELLPEDIDAIDDLPVPRWRDVLHGHRAAEAEILTAYKTGRLHHGFIVGGPEGIGKATLAFRIARFLLRHPDPTSDAVQAATDMRIDPADPVARKVAHLSHPDLAVLRRSINPDTKKLRTVISVDDTRRLLHLFESTSGALGWRVAIVDSADDLNAASGNALLKMLEEPPPRAIFLILAHKPAMVMPTIRSRCRRLTLEPLSEADCATVVGELLPDLDPEVRAEAVKRSGGSPRRALALTDEAQLAVVAATEALLSGLPRIDVRALHALADKVARRDHEGEMLLLRDTLAGWVSERIRAGVERGEEVRGLARLAERFAAAEEQHRLADIYNLDRKQAVIRTFTEVASALGRPRG